jgi:hypothetical protein
MRIIFSVRMRSSGHVRRMEEKINACRILVGKPLRRETTMDT